MKFCYIDETGNNSHSTLSVMAGILIDSYKIRKHRDIFSKERSQLFAEFSKGNDGKKAPEIKTSQIHEGKSGWSNVDPGKRKDFLKFACNLSTTIPCTIFFSVIDFEKLKNSSHALKPVLSGYWQWQACHLILQIQAHHFHAKNNKGNTLMIFDDHKGDLEPLQSALSNHGELHAFYAHCVKRKRKELNHDEKLSQIVDMYAIPSKNSLLTQLADIYAYIIRRHIEFSQSAEEQYAGEKDFFQNCFSFLWSQIINNKKYFSRKDIAVCEFLSTIAPDNLLQIMKVS